MNYPVPQYPAQPYAQPQQPMPPQAPAPQYPQAPYGQPPVQQQPYPAQPYAQQPQQAPAQPLAEGSLDAFYGQPSAASGPSLSWTGPDGSPKPIGTTYVGVVARDVTNADVQQQTDFNTKAPLFYRDGRPKFAMKVPLRVQPSNEFPDGEASWYVKGQARDELVRAMSAVGVTGSPKEGAVIQITLVQRRNMGRGMNPANVVQVTYQPGAGGAPAPEQPTVAQAAPPAYPAGVDQTVQQQGAAPAWAGQPVAQASPEQAPVQQHQVPQQAAPAPQVTQQQAPAQQLAPPSNLTPEQQALMAQMTGQAGTPAA